MKKVLLGKRVKKIREHQGLNQSAFAKKLGLTQASLSKIERGLMMPSASFVFSLRRKFKVNLNNYLVQ